LKIEIGILLAVFALRGNGAAQGFVNLDFENAQIVPLAGSPYYPYGIAATNALPGWTVFVGNSQQSQITYNDPALGSTWVNLWATNEYVIDGDYSVLLQGGLNDSGDSSASISQIGLVPVGTESLLFKAQTYPNGELPAGSLLVSLGGQNISFFVVSTEPNYTLYGGNIPSAFAGQSEQLTISALEGYSTDYGWTIDDIQFSPSSVPEPNVLCLSALSGLLLMWRTRRIFSKA
jgi:hypothetical protein